MPIWLNHVYQYPVPLSCLPFALLLSGVVVLLVFFSRGMKETMIIPITFLVIGVFLVCSSTIGRGVQVYSFIN